MLKLNMNVSTHKACALSHNSANAAYDVSVFVFYILMVFSPLMAIVDLDFDYFKLFFFLAVTIVAIIVAFPINGYDNTVILISVGILILFTVFGYFEKGALSALVLYAAYNGVHRQGVVVCAFFTLLVINCIIMLFQLTGCEPGVYGFSNYVNIGSIPVCIDDFDYASSNFLPQIRPSGIFPAPTYMSFFLILLYAVIVFLIKRNGELFLAMTGAIFALSGSTMGFVLILLLVVNSFYNKTIAWVILGYMFTLLIYYYFLPDIFLYNYSVEDFYNSIIDRDMTESVATTNIALYAIMLVMFVTFVVIMFFSDSGFRGKLFDLIQVAIVMFGPMLLHDLSASVFSFFIFGFCFGVIGFVLIEKPVKNLIIND